MTTLPEFAVGDEITLTIDDGTRTRTWHGIYTGSGQALTTARESGGHAHVLISRPCEGTRTWLRMATATDTQPDPQGLPQVGPDHEFHMAGLNVCLDAAAVTVAPLTAEGDAWMREHERPARKKDRLIARFAEFDPEAAARLDGIIEDIEDAAYRMGQHDEAASRY